MDRIADFMAKIAVKYANAVLQLQGPLRTQVIYGLISSIIDYLIDVRREANIDHILVKFAPEFCSQFLEQVAIRIKERKLNILPVHTLAKLIEHSIMVLSTKSTERSPHVFENVFSTSEDVEKWIKAIDKHYITVGMTHIQSWLSKEQLSDHDKISIFRTLFYVAYVSQHDVIVPITLFYDKLNATVEPKAREIVVDIIIGELVNIFPTLAITDQKRLFALFFTVGTDASKKYMVLLHQSPEAFLLLFQTIIESIGDKEVAEQVVNDIVQKYSDTKNKKNKSYRIAALLFLGNLLQKGFVTNFAMKNTTVLQYLVKDLGPLQQENFRWGALRNIHYPSLEAILSEAEKYKLYVFILLNEKSSYKLQIYCYWKRSDKKTELNIAYLNYVCRCAEFEFDMAKRRVYKIVKPLLLQVQILQF